MLEKFIEYDLVRTVGYESGEWTTLTRRVPQESLSIPLMFKLFIDNLTGRLAAVKAGISKHPANMYADDVLLMAYSRDALQILLDICSSWAKSNSMYWIPVNFATLIVEQNSIPVALERQRLRTVTEENYLGLKISTKELINTELYEIIKSAWRRVH